jgi:Cof subfamily protein (haloacid dehalogenase superfamily)
MTDRPKIRLVIADVDGTLVTHDKVLTEAAKQAVRDLKAAGIGFSITSGRPPRGMSMLIAPLALQLPIAGFNGGVFAQPDLSVIERHALDRPVAQETVALLSARALDVWIYTEDEWLIRDKTAPYVARETSTVRFEAKVVPRFTEDQLSKVIKIVGVSDNRALMLETQSEAQRVLGSRASAALSQPYYLDVTHPKANKGVVVETLSRMCSIPLENIATIGDMPNDILMFKKSGFSIAMGNAGVDVKAQARAVTDSNEEDGFAKAMQKFILHPTA